MPEALYGYDLFGEVVKPPTRGLIADEFLVPPFTVLNAREGFWQERKQAWGRMGIEGEVGRDAKTYNMGLGANKENGWTIEDNKGSGTSIFDPVVCELAYRWFTKQGQQILDPFAGGSVRGIVAHELGRRYWGCDLRPEQIEANNEQAERIQPDNRPQWVCGDAIDAVPNAPDADFIFSCPPYGDLEVYSDDPKDLSNMSWDAFMDAYRIIIRLACQRLRNNRFACFVVGDFRDGKGHYRDFVSKTIAAFQASGLHLYNECILVTAVGSLPIRIGRQFRSGRKLGKTHQNILVFVKGDWKEAARVCGAEDTEPEETIED